MKIAVIADHDVSLLNGASLQSRQLTEWLLDHGHEVHLINPGSGQRRTQPKRNLRIHSVPSFTVPSYREYRIPLPFLAPALWLKEWEVDLIHAETMNPLLLLLGYWIKKRAKIPMFNVLTANLPYYAPILLPRDNGVKKSIVRFGKAMMNAISDRIEGTFILSEGVRKSLTQEFFSIDQAKIYSLKRPLDPELFAARNLSSGFERKNAVPPGCRLVTLSRLCRTKNVDFVMRAFARHIYPKNKALHLIVAGHGPLEESLREMRSELECPNIHFHGPVPFEAVPDFLREADFFLYGSLSETFGNIVCEAKYAGLPVVALDDRGGIREQIVNRQTGILVGRVDEREFGLRFLELLKDPELQTHIRRRARADVLLNHSPDKIYANLLAIYDRAVRGKHGDDSKISPVKHQS